MKNKCGNCGRSKLIFLAYQKQNLCENCFSRLIERRIRHNLRNKHIIDENPIVIIDDNSASFKATRFVLEKISKQMPKLKLFFSKKSRKGFKKIICRSLEQENIDFLKKILKEENTERHDNPNKTFSNPTANIPQKELEKFCDIHDIEYDKSKYSLYEMDILLMLENIMKIRPGAMFSIQKISEKLT